MTLHGKNLPAIELEAKGKGVGRLETQERNLLPSGAWLPSPVLGTDPWGHSDIFLQCWLIILLLELQIQGSNGTVNTSRRGRNPTRGTLKQRKQLQNHSVQSGPVTGQMEVWIVWFYQQNRGRKRFKMRLCYFPQFLLWNLPEMNFKYRQSLSREWMGISQQELCREVVPLWKMWRGSGCDE